MANSIYLFLFETFLSYENHLIMFSGQSSRSSPAWLIQKLQRMWWWWRTSCSLTLSRSWLWSFAEEFVLSRLRIIRVREAVKIKNVFYAEVRLKETQANHGLIRLDNVPWETFLFWLLLHPGLCWHERGDQGEGVERGDEWTQVSCGGQHEWRPPGVPWTHPPQHLLQLLWHRSRLVMIKD